MKKEALLTAETSYERAVAFFQEKKYAEALHHFDIAVEKDTQNPFRYASRAYAKAHVGDVKGAIADYQEALRLDPEDAIAWNNLGLLEEQLGYKKEAQEKFAKADALASRDEILQRFNEIEESRRNNQTQPTAPLNRWQIIRDVFLKKQTFQQFIRFIRTGKIS